MSAVSDADDRDGDFDLGESPWPTTSRPVPEPPAAPIFVEVKPTALEETALEETALEETELEETAPVPVAEPGLPDPARKPPAEHPAEIVTATVIAPAVTVRQPQARRARPRPQLLAVALAAGLAAAAIVVAVVSSANGANKPETGRKAGTNAGSPVAAPPMSSTTSAAASTSASTSTPAPKVSSSPSSAASSPASPSSTSDTSDAAGTTTGVVRTDSGSSAPASPIHSRASTTASAPVIVTTTPAAPKTSMYYSGGSCGTTWRMYGSWQDLPGSSIDGCGDGYTRTQTGNHGNIDWYFNPGTGVACTFRVYIPDSDSITTISAHYLLYGSSDHSNQLHEHYMQQKGHGGTWLTFNSTPYSSTTGSFDLFLYDDRDTGQEEVAAAATATCS